MLNTECSCKTYINGSYCHEIHVLVELGYLICNYRRFFQVLAPSQYLW